MSHISEYKCKIKDIDFFTHFLENKFGITVTRGEHSIQQFGSNRVQCIASATLPGWRYPVAITEDGNIKYDHWGSETNSMDRMYEAVQGYWEESIENAIDWTQVENLEKTTLPNGDLQMVLEY